MDSCDCEIERQHRHFLEYRLNVRVAALSLRDRSSAMQAVQQFRRGHRRQRERFAAERCQKLWQIDPRTLTGDEDAGIDQRGHFDFSAFGCLRTCRSTASRYSSPGCGNERSNSTKSRPVKVLVRTGTISQTGSPPRFTTKVSLRYRTRFTTSENRRAASVAEISDFMII